MNAVQLRPANTRLGDLLNYAKGQYGFRDQVRDTAVIVGLHANLDPDTVRPVDLATVMLNDTLHLILGSNPVSRAKELLMRLGDHELPCPSRREPHYYSTLVRHLLEEVALLRITDEAGRTLLAMPPPDPFVQSRLDACERRMRVARAG